MRTRLIKFIWGVGSAFLLAFIASSAYDAWKLHQQIELANKSELTNLARALSLETERGFQAVDVMLIDTAQWYRARAGQLLPDDIRAELAKRTSAVPQVSVLTIVNAHGQQIYRSRPTGEPLADVSDRMYFQAQRQSEAGMFINPPIVTRTEHRESLVVSRRLDNEDGSFAGVVTAIVKLDDLRRAYSAIDLGKRSSVIMVFDDSLLVVRYPYDERVDARGRYPELVAMKDKPAFVATSPIDARDKLIAVVGVSQRPLMVGVTRDRDDLLQPWREEVRSLALRLAALSVFGVIIMCWLQQQLQRMRAGEQALRQSEERYALAMDAANEGHAEWNISELTCFASGKWKSQHEIAQSSEPGAVEDLPQLPALHPDDRTIVRAAIDDHLSGSTDEIVIEYRICRTGLPEDDPDRWRWINMRGRCLRDPAGVPQRLFCATTDVSARRSAEADRTRLESQLSQARHLEALGTLAGGIAHDFNNILGAILGHGEMAQRDAVQGTALRRHVDRVMQAGLRAKLLVRRILDFSGAGVRERGFVHVQEAVDEALLLLAPSVPSAIHLLNDRLSSDPAAIQGDPTQIHQLISNLCTNAIAAMPHGGDLIVRVSRQELDTRRTLSHGCIGPGHVVLVSVRDTGTGISPEVFARMFDPFFSTKSVGEGTGLGLSVVHGIVGDLQGALSVDTVLGQGTCFTVWLPVAGEFAPALAQEVDELPRGNSQVVMVVDDEEALVEFAEDILAELGYEPVGYTSSTTALQAFLAEPDRFDAMLTDETMPQLTGVELVQEVTRVRPDFRAIVMSGYGGEQLESKVCKAGAVELLRKPLAVRDVAECLARVFALAHVE